MELGEGWNAYELVYEVENNNSFQLTEDFDLFGTSQSSKRRPGADERFTVKAGTIGKFISDTERIAQLEYAHSGLALLGKRLEANLTEDTYDTALPLLDTED